MKSPRAHLADVLRGWRVHVRVCAILCFVAMEKHHKLRRPPGSSIHGCNICGKEGHQAANCPNGTVDWKEKYGMDFFFIPRPYYELLAENYVEHDLEKLKKRAKAFAKKKMEEEEREKKKAAWKPKSTPPENEAVQPIQADAPVAEEPIREVENAQPIMVASVQHQGQETIATQEAMVPEQAPPSTNLWETYYDTYGRPYYHNRTTGTTQWEKPAELGG